MAQHEIELPLKDATEPEIADELRQRGGKLQVPALLHDDQILYESDAIIAFLEEQR